MDEAPRSSRPTPRTPAAIEAELRRRVRQALAQAREAGDGELDDASLAEIIAQAVAVAVSWHVEAPEHTRNATLSSRSWRPAGGPRGGGGPPPRREYPQRGEFQDRREFQERRDYDEPRRYDDPRRGGGYGPPRRPPFEEFEPEGDYGPPPRFPRGGPPRQGPSRSGPRPGPRPGGRKPPMGRGGGGGFGPRKPRRNG